MKIRSHAEVTPWPRRGPNLAELAFSVDPFDRFAAQAIVSTANGGTGISLARTCHVYELYPVGDEANVQLDQLIPLGSYVPKNGHASRAVRLSDLKAARTCEDVWTSSDQAESDGPEDNEVGDER